MGLIVPEKDRKQLLPMEYPWAYQKYMAGCANHWMPQEVPLQKDINQWNSSTELSDVERNVVMNNLGFFATSEILVADNLAIELYDWIRNPECRMYLTRQMFEESIHSDSFMYICTSLGLDENELYTMYKKTDSISERHNLLDDANFSGVDEQGKIVAVMGKAFLFYVILEGIWFYTSFAQLLSLGNRNLMPGLCEIIEFIMRDESVHVNFGIDLINQLRTEHADMIKDMQADFDGYMVRVIREAVRIEKDVSAKRVLAHPLPGINLEQCIMYLEYIANRRLNQLGLDSIYAQTESPFLWLNEVLDTEKEKNFFESTVMNYKSAAKLVWD